MLSEHGCKIAPNTYWVARKRPVSKRACRDAELVVEIRRVYAENLFVYGADKVWAQLNREDVRVARLTGLVHHSDRGVQYLSVRYSERLAGNAIVASVGSKGDSYDNSLVESFNGLYKWELI